MLHVLGYYPCVISQLNLYFMCSAWDYAQGKLVIPNQGLVGNMLITIPFDFAPSGLKVGAYF